MTGASSDWVSRLNPILNPDSPVGQLAQELRKLARTPSVNSLTEFAESVRYSKAHVSEALSGRKVPAPGVIEEICKICKADEPTRARLYEMRAKAINSRPPGPPPTDPSPPGPIPVEPSPPGPARWRKSLVLLVVTLVGLATAGVVGWVGWEDAGVPGCWHRPFLGQVEVRSIGGQCIGYSDAGYFRFNDEPGQERLRDVQNKIFDQNRTVRDRWEQSNRIHPYITIVYVAALTGRPAANNEEAYAAEREELEGLAVAQYDGIRDPESSPEVPLLNIVIANGGAQLEYASQVVDMIAALAAEDPTVVGVIGMGESRSNTAEAVQKLNKIGLPLIAPASTADDFDQNSRLYLQLSAPNREQARAIHEYSTQVLKVPDARLYWTVGKNSNFDRDLYVRTLVNDLVAVFGTKIDNRGEFDGSINRDVCGYQGILIFAGRWTEFPNFLRTIEGECGSNPPVHVVADDSVERYMDNPTLRRSAPGTISVTYVSKSVFGSCDYLRVAAANKDSARDRYLRLIQTPGLLEPPRCEPGGNEQAAGARSALTYDAATIILRAVKSLGQELRRGSPPPEWDPHSVRPITVHTKVVEQIHESPFDGVGGMIKFDGDSGEPTDKLISLMYVATIPATQARPVEVFHCGRAYPNDDPTCAPGRANRAPG